MNEWTFVFITAAVLLALFCWLMQHYEKRRAKRELDEGLKRAAQGFESHNPRHRQ